MMGYDAGLAASPLARDTLEVGRRVKLSSGFSAADNPLSKHPARSTGSAHAGILQSLFPALGSLLLLQPETCQITPSNLLALK
jgi:hypothetical protein